MRKLAIDLTYQPTGGTLTQIIEIIKNVDSYDFAKVVFYITSDNINLFEGANEKKIILKNVLFSNKSTGKSNASACTSWGRDKVTAPVSDGEVRTLIAAIKEEISCSGLFILSQYLETGLKQSFTEIS